jgi:hypothetical protein
MIRPAGALLLFAAAAPPAWAQSDDERNADAREDLIREVERGYYFAANVGSTIYTNTHGITTNNGSLLSPVISLNIGVGSDFIDRERLSVAWQISFQQSLQNGPREDEVTQLPAYVQGDIHTFAGVATLEASAYPTRRLGIGIKAGGGVMVIPLLMHPVTYEEVIVAAWGQRAQVHEAPLAVITGGPTVEYYTKLSHFSVGVDVDISYVFDFDLGIMPSGFLKYTF